MSPRRQFAGGLLIALAAIVFIGISLSTAIAEGRLVIDLPTARPTGTSVWTPLPTATPGALSTQTLLPTASLIPTLPTASTNCPPPPTWVPYLVQPGDTLESLAAQVGTSPQMLAGANCLAATGLAEGSVIFLPRLPLTATPTFTPAPSATLFPTATGIPCGPPLSWIIYIVQPGDTLFSIAQRYYTTVYALQAANCLGGSTYIQAGASLWVPNVATRTPTPTPTSSALPSATPTLFITATPTPSPTATNTPLPTATPTETPIPPSPTPTDTPPSPTSTGTARPAATSYP